MKLYYISDGKDKFGPFTVEELKNKTLTEDTLVWYQGLDKWKLAKNVEEINAVFPQIKQKHIIQLNKNDNGKKSSDNFIVKEVEKKKLNTKRSYLILIIILFVSLVGLFIWLKDDIFKKLSIETEQQILVQKKTDAAVNTISTFFDELNNQNYQEAYKLTSHARWNSLSNFKQYLRHWKILEVQEINGKSYYSRYGADTILNVKYRGIVDESGTILDRDFDYHLKKFNTVWKIVRIYEPRNPDYNILKNNEVPESAEDAVIKFLNFLDRKLFIKAHKLTDNPNWGNEKQFSSYDQFGCILSVEVYSITEIESDYNDLKVIYARYYASDPCNDSGIKEIKFYLSNNTDYWKIVASESLN